LVFIYVGLLSSLFHCADNVHFASSSHLVKTLTDADIQFRFQVQTLSVYC